MSTGTDWHLKGLKKNTLIWFPVIAQKRKESVEYTLNNFSTYFDAYKPRTTHLFKSDKQTLEKILPKIQSNGNFVASQILHSSSDLGLTHKLEAVHKNGWVFCFDGLQIRATKTIFLGELKLDTLLEKTGVPHEDSNTFNDFTNCINEVFPNVNIESSYSYYTVEETNWEKIGLRREGDAQLRLIVNDPHYVTITAINFTNWGKDFCVYIGDENQINERLAHDSFIGHEIFLFTSFFRDKYNEANNYRNNCKTDFGGAIAPVWNILKKHQSWNNVKKAMRAVYSTKDFIEKGKILLAQLEKTVDNRWAFFNGPRQIWLMNEEQDFEEKIQYPTKHFFEFRLEDLKVKRLSDQPVKPSYANDVQEFGDTINAIDDQIGELYERQRDLLTAFQTEFSLYAVWFAIGAIGIAILSLLIPR
jgi:hypothetical protein